ncbi:MAG: hypothetical protein LBI39_01730 [Puniceicoccales bacterium]|jgi:DNA polymerase III epsilon subunit-like protein|nr:hypothetical protein [Puniceicoccales bacterium]
MDLGCCRRTFAIDFEGNGRDGILEFGAICLEDGRMRMVGQSFLRCRRVDDIFLRRRKISSVHVEAAPFPEKFFNLFKDMRRNGILAAHHAQTEDALLRKLWPTPGFVPDWGGDPAGNAMGWGPWLDSCALAKKFWPGLPAYSLDRVLAFLRLEERWRALGVALCGGGRHRHHCAPYDAIGCALIVDRCLRESGKDLLCLLRRTGAAPQLSFF